MNAKKFSYLMIALVTVLCLAIISIVVIGDGLFKKQSEKLSSLKAQNQVIKEQEVSLAQAKADIEKYQDLDTIAKSVVPQDKDQAKTVREINAIALESSVKLQQISFSTSNLGQAVPKAPATTESGETTPKSTAQPSISQVKPIPGINGVYGLEITVSSGDANPVSYYRFLQFLEKLESNRRTAHVSNINVVPTDNRNEVTFSLVLTAYLKP
ncbi:MAG TPA: hypothetical protein VD947_03015 [Patescibacteria group bacterium]|nr:hypothetical protein [Patescibacteria group bacterium]